MNPEGKCLSLSDFMQQSGAKAVAKHKGALPGPLSASGEVMSYIAVDKVWKEAAVYAKSLAGVVVLFSVKKRTDAGEVTPTGIAITISKQVIVTLGTDFVLS